MVVGLSFNLKGGHRRIWVGCSARMDGVWCSGKGFLRAFFFMVSSSLYLLGGPDGLWISSGENTWPEKVKSILINLIHQCFENIEMTLKLTDRHIEELSRLGVTWLIMVLFTSTVCTGFNGCWNYYNNSTEWASVWFLTRSIQR